MHIESERHRSPSPGLTPLIDVVFILLVFFMLATRFGEWQDLPVQVSEAREVEADDTRVVRIQVLAGAEVELDGESLTSETLAERLRELPDDTRVQIRGDDAASLQHLLAITDRVRDAGFRDARLELLP